MEVLRPATRLALNEGIRVRDEDKIAFNPTSGCIAELNDLAFVLLKAAQDEKSIEEVSLALAEHYSVEQSILLTDIIDFYEQMVSKGFLRSI